MLPKDVFFIEILYLSRLKWTDERTIISRGKKYNERVKRMNKVLLPMTSQYELIQTQKECFLPLVLKVPS